jgi:hypothetical protein
MEPLARGANFSTQFMARRMVKKRPKVKVFDWRWLPVHE